MTIRDLQLPWTDQELEQFEPVPYLIEQANPDIIPLLYRNIPFVPVKGLPYIFVVVGPSGAGKDAVSMPLIEQGVLVHAVTATSRGRRVEKDEPEHSMIWMRPPKEDENREEYYEHLVEEYELIEHDVHFGNLYGLPKASIDTAIARGNVLIRTEPIGARTILNKLGKTANIVVVFIVPESLQQVWDRHRDRENVQMRFIKAVEEIRDAPTISNYYILNPVVMNGEPGLPKAQAALRELVKSLA